MPISRTMAFRLRQYVTAPRPTDADLLARFVATRDDDAFAELVRRHGPAVLAVCRRITGNRHDADDAFQVTFLVLARKADRVRPASALGGWLYGVAARAARKALARTCRRRDREAAAGDLPDVPQSDPAGHDPDTVRAVLEEVARLPVTQRAAVVLCELEGRPRSAAAKELGVPEGTLSSRLAAARKCLAARLRDRGLAPAVLAAVAGAVGHPVLAAEAVRLGSVPTSPRIENLMEAVMNPTFGSNLKLAAVAVGAVVAIGLSVIAGEPPKPPKPPDPPAEKKQRSDVPAPGGRLLLNKVNGFDVFAPDGEELASVRLGKDGSPGGWLSPDGTQVAYLVPKGQEQGEEEKYQVALRDAVGGRFVTTIDVEACQLCWSPDGKALYASWFANEEREIRGVHSRIDLAARAVGQLDWPAGVRPIEWSRDGKAVLVSKLAYGRVLLALMSPDGKRFTDLWGADIQDDGWLVEARLSPDGRRVLYADCPPGKKAHQDRGMTSRLYVFDIAAKKRSDVARVPPNATVLFCCWSPDGKKIAYVWRSRHAELAEKLARGVELSAAENATKIRMFLTVANADGSGARTVASAKGAHLIDLPLGGIDWR